MVNAVTYKFSSDWELADLVRFDMGITDKGTAKNQFSLSIEATKGNIKWRDNNEDKVKEWLKNVLQNFTVNNVKKEKNNFFN
jgi:hypothetical protein